MTVLRNLVFGIVFLTGSVVVVLLSPVARLAGRDALRRHGSMWMRFHEWATRTLLDVRPVVIGELPPGPVLYAAKHEAMYEAVELPVLLGFPAVVMKRELMRIPIWGWAARGYGVIVVDRQASAAALRNLMREGAAATAAGRSILIFPEGTRVQPGDTPELRAGFAGLYRLLKLPVVPIAIDSGRRWPRHGLKRAGPVRFLIGETVPPGLPRAEAERRVWTAINALNTAAG